MIKQIFICLLDHHLLAMILDHRLKVQVSIQSDCNIDLQLSLLLIYDASLQNLSSYPLLGEDKNLHKIEPAIAKLEILEKNSKME